MLYDLMGQLGRGSIPVLTNSSRMVPNQILFLSLNLSAHYILLPCNDLTAAIYFRLTCSLKTENS